MGISLFSGQIQVGIYIVLILVAFAFYVGWRRSLVSLIVTGLVCFGIFAIQLFPTQFYSKYSLRSQISYEESVGYSVDPLYFLVHPFAPALFGSMTSISWDSLDTEKLDEIPKTKWLDRMFGGLPNEMNFYLGLLPFFLLPFCFFSNEIFIPVHQSLF